MPAKQLLHDEHLILASNQIHIVSESPNDYEVWLNSDVGDFDGLCIGYGVSREAAVADAIDVLEQGARALRGEAQETASGGWVMIGNLWWYRFWIVWSMTATANSLGCVYRADSVPVPWFHAPIIVGHIIFAGLHVFWLVKAKAKIES